MTFQPQFCDQLSIISGEEKVLDIFNHGRFNHMPQLVGKEIFSGDQWLISKTGNSYKLSTKFLDRTVWLDVIEGGLFDGLLIMVPEDKYTGRLWQIEENTQGENLFKISTNFRGNKKFIDIYQNGNFNNMPYITYETNARGQLWNIETSKHNVLKSTMEID
jgi:hypothetical protein